jgi:hypothetical protein
MKHADNLHSLYLQRKDISFWSFVTVVEKHTAHAGAPG